jgi:hypothetical protein
LFFSAEPCDIVSNFVYESDGTITANCEASEVSYVAELLQSVGEPSEKLPEVTCSFFKKNRALVKVVERDRNRAEAIIGALIYRYFASSLPSIEVGAES